jgi:hypothetical protein
MNSSNTITVKVAHDTNRADRIQGTRQFGHCGTGGCKWKSWARKAANRASRKAARIAMSKEAI